ncbi:MAG: TIGR03759 family integrating conjugative element protein [Candidatus Thiodiazotropha sp. (ex Lucinoma borealis)]|nr:TIGR03759 family integrating conjugative element protein [Candidatus Thiodiazotropha sp. (ex Lucinoma borealis)]MCU7865412.1 TIGR03759 family integrating conjugative element protein [Candidatus Thiodiazotropha sp. (ex Lucinoma borealis)]
MKNYTGLLFTFFLSYPRLVALVLSASFFSQVMGESRSETSFSPIIQYSVNVESMGLDGWGLSQEENERYKMIMAGPRGNWSPDLDPLSVLGINAQNDTERRLYARRLAKMEFERVQRETRFEQFYLAEFKLLYPDMPLYRKPPPLVRSTMQTDPHRKVLKVKLPCNPSDPCFNTIGPALNKATTRPVDLYFYGMQSMDEIQTWAMHAGIEPESVRARIITLNLGEALPDQKSGTAK